MAKLIVNDERLIGTNSNLIAPLLIGFGVGLLVWVLTFLFERFVAQQLICNFLDIEACANTVVISGNIATIIGALAGLTALIRSGARRPLLIVLASAVALWGLATWLVGLVWFEALIYTGLLYAVAYLVFYWLVRVRKLLLAVAISAIVVLITRAITSL